MSPNADCCNVKLNILITLQIEKATKIKTCNFDILLLFYYNLSYSCQMSKNVFSSR